MGYGFGHYTFGMVWVWVPYISIYIFFSAYILSRANGHLVKANTMNCNCFHFSFLYSLLVLLLHQYILQRLLAACKCKRFSSWPIYLKSINMSIVSMCVCIFVCVYSFPFHSNCMATQGCEIAFHWFSFIAKALGIKFVHGIWTFELSQCAFFFFFKPHIHLLFSCSIAHVHAHFLIPMQFYVKLLFHWQTYEFMALNAKLCTNTPKPSGCTFFVCIIYFVNQSIWFSIPLWKIFLVNFFFLTKRTFNGYSEYWQFSTYGLVPIVQWILAIILSDALERRLIPSNWLVWKLKWKWWLRRRVREWD